MMKGWKSFLIQVAVIGLGILVGFLLLDLFNIRF